MSNAHASRLGRFRAGHHFELFRRQSDCPVLKKLESGMPEPSEEDTRSPATVAQSKLGASKGGKARAKTLSKKRRTEISRKAARARWRHH